MSLYFSDRFWHLSEFSVLESGKIHPLSWLCDTKSHETIICNKSGRLELCWCEGSMGWKGSWGKKNLWCELAGEDWFYWDSYREGTQRDRCQMFKWDTVSVWVSWHKSRGLRATWALWRLDQSLCAALCESPLWPPHFHMPCFLWKSLGDSSNAPIYLAFWPLFHPWIFIGR